MLKIITFLRVICVVQESEKLSRMRSRVRYLSCTEKTKELIMDSRPGAKLVLEVV